jgi:membrane protease YdiL (CAAX protease family)
MSMEAIAKSAAPWHGLLIFAGLALIKAGALPLPWPLYLIFPLALYAGVVLAVPLLRATPPRLSIGRVGGPAIAFAVALCIATSGVLIAFHLLARPDVSNFVIRLPLSGTVALILVGAVFSLVNAVLEELIFRGVLWEVIAAEWNPRVALVVTALLFGVFHLHGYPSGLFGVILASLYGVGLGLLRLSTGGLGLAIACHIFADATIFSLLAWSGGFTPSPGAQ